MCDSIPNEDQLDFFCSFDKFINDHNTRNYKEAY